MTPLGSASRSTVKPWFIEVISTLPVVNPARDDWRRGGPGAFLGFGAEGEAQHLVAEADAEDGLAAGDELLDFGHGVFAGGGGVTGAVGQEDAIGLHGEDIRCQRIGGNDGDITAHARQAAQDVALEAVVNGDDFILAAFGIGVARGPVPDLFIPVQALGEGYILGEVETFEAAQAFAMATSSFTSNLPLASWATTPLGMPLSRMILVSSRVSTPLEPDYAAGLQPFVEMLGGAVIGRIGDGSLDDAALDRGGGGEIGGFEVVIIGADIADVGKGEGDDLAGIGLVGEDFLIAGHGGVEDTSPPRRLQRRDPGLR